ncbi:MAG TPA: ABC transporter permease [Bryobacteraceae bacterium]|nr:ABC transporter permease [Bryobacteraceae bacterium]
MLDYFIPWIETFQEFLFLAARAFRNIFRGPHYVDDILIQMDVIGVGSLPIVVLIGFFSGIIMGLQMGRALTTYGAQGQIGQIVSISLVREFGPVLTALLVAGRNASGIASEIGSMKVTEQIDAMRALGTDPIQKLVTPRLIATMFVLPLLTIIADFIGMFGGALIAFGLLNITWSEFWNNGWRALIYQDLFQGLIKPFLFAIIISLVGCLYGMRTSGGTQGVGRATTQAVVVSSIWIFVITAFIDPLFFT